MERQFLRILQRLPPEPAQGLCLAVLRCGGPLAGRGPFSDPSLATTLAGLTLSNPLGLAAGFDKNAIALRGLRKSGLGFAEVGTITLNQRTGNPKPRLHRLAARRGIINHMGLNNDGVMAIAERLRARPRPCDFVVGANIGSAQADTRAFASECAKVLGHCGAFVDFATINVSCPNIAGQEHPDGGAALEYLLGQLLAERDALPQPLPLFLKVSPDLSDARLKETVELACANGIDGLVATNTMAWHDQTAHGGLSGAPLFARSTEVLAKLFAFSNGRIPLIGVGGISTGEQAYAKVCAGASALQIYSGLPWIGFAGVQRILETLAERLVQDGFTNIAEAVGSQPNLWRSLPAGGADARIQPEGGLRIPRSSAG